MSERKQITSNALSAYGVRALTAFSALLLTPYLFRRLGEEGFGTWSIMFVLLTMLELIELGFSASVVKFVAEYRGSGRPAEVQSSLSVGIVIMGGLGVVACLATVGAGQLLSGIAAPGHTRDFELGMALIGLAMLVRFPCAPFLGSLKGYGRYDLFNLTQAILLVASTGGSILLVELGYGVLGIAVAYAVSLAATGILAVVLLARLDPGLSLRPRAGTWAHRRRLLAFGGFALLSDSMIFIGQRMDVLVIAAIRNAAAAAPYAAALKLQSGVQALAMPLMHLLMPMVSELWGRGEREEAIRRLKLTTRLAAQATIPLAVGIALFSPELTRLWLGADRPESIVPIVVTLLAVQIVTMTAAPTEAALVGIGKVRTIGTLSAIEGIGNISLSIFLVSRYGPIGAALGTLCTSALLAPVKFPLFCRATGEPVWRFARESLGVGVVSTLPAVAAMVAARLFLPDGLGAVAVAAVVGGTLTVSIAARQLGAGRIRELLGRGPDASDERALELGSRLPERGDTVL